MSQTEESSFNNTPPTPAEVLIDVPDKLLPTLDKISAVTNPQYQQLVADMLRLVPRDVLLSIVRSKPDSKLKIIELNNNKRGNSRHVRYASWIKRGDMLECFKDVDWEAIMGVVMNQKDHEICWAVVVSELIRALILIERPETDPNITYSIQDLIDFTNPVERRILTKPSHYCYTSSINKGMRYVMENGIQKEVDRPFVGCPRDIPDRTISERVYIKDFKAINTIEEALLQLKHQPIAAAVAMFQPEYKNIGDNIYRGPVQQDSRFVGLHAISLLSAGTKNGERYVKARGSHGEDYGKDGNLKISLDVMLAYIPTPGEEIDIMGHKYFAQPSSLVRRFSFPRLHTRDEERQMKMRRVS